MESLHNSNKASTLEKNLETIFKNVRKAAEKSGRSFEDITILAAVKTQNVDDINRAIAAGITHIGENRVQELTEKYDGYNKANTKIEFIGHLQTNKVKYIVDKVDRIQSVDSLSLAMEINRQCAKIGKIMDILVEVNIGREESKSGIYLENLPTLLDQLAVLSNVSVHGLMAIPPICEDKALLNKYFNALYKEFLDIRAKKIDNIYMDKLSMGMSGDYFDAIVCGANIIRLGTAVFGLRKKVED